MAANDNHEHAAGNSAMTFMYVGDIMIDMELGDFTSHGTYVAGFTDATVDDPNAMHTKRILTL